FGLYGNSIFKGNWPQVVIDRIAERSLLEGFPESRLPVFSAEEIDYIKGTYDFLALNHYGTHMVNATTEAVIGDPSYAADISVVPWGLRNLLVWLKNTYGDIEIIITENGLSDRSGTLDDYHRVAYFQTYLSACLDAIYEDGVNLSTYVAWSIIDDWEWTGGFV
ncbi:hypothetical protein NQ314_013925, partial [Rhamnusium bicolor]